MLRLISFCLIGLLLGCQNSGTEEKRSESSPAQPNVVLLIGDDQGYPYFGFMGADYVQTPHMDALAASGTVFTQGYVPENHCRPSLQSLMTGTLPIDYKRAVDDLMIAEAAAIRFASSEEERKWRRDFRHHAMQYFKTLPLHLADKGYLSFQGGKWWEFNYDNGGFSHGMTTGWSEEDRAQGGKWFKQFMGGDGLQLARATMQPVYDFIDNHADQPFFIWYAPELPHYPFDAPEKYYNLYTNEDMTESAKRYYANCTWFDDGVGSLLNYLKEKGLYDNTLFVYVNDNGWEQAPGQEFRHDSLRWHNGGDKGKLSIYDQSFRTPVIFSWTGQIASGVRKSDLIESVDIPATILDYVGIPVPADYYGRSYRPILEGTVSDPRDVIIGNSNKVRSAEDYMGQDIEGYWLRNQDWFFRWVVSEDEKALYHMRTDPNNDNNVAEEYPDVVSQLSGQVEMWRKEKGVF